MVSTVRSFGKVLADVGRAREWVSKNDENWRRGARTWVTMMRATPGMGADAGWLFAAAAFLQCRIFVHFQPLGRKLKTTVFEAPATAPVSMRGTLDIHLGYIDNGDGGNHYVSLPVDEGRLRTSLLLTTATAIAASTLA